MTIIELRGVNVKYGDTPVLINFNLTIRRGDYLGLLGPNGSGKTTLMKTILGIVKPDSGEVLVYGKPLSNHNRDKIGYVSQLHAVNREFPARVHEIVEMGRYGMRGFGRRLTREDHEAVKFALHKVHMEEFFDRPIGHLSGGEQQKVFVAQALVRNPEILLLDEPTSALDFVMVKDFLDLLEDLRDNWEMTIVAIHHNLDLLRPYCNRLVVMNRTIWYDGTPNGPGAEEGILRGYGISSIKPGVHVGANAHDRHDP
ncbi:MAG: metal ABC transporter ATP-binding protein [Promethearchaeota archaeon]